MYRFSPTDSLGLGNHIPWERLDPTNRMIPGKWVYPLKIVLTPGVIPRAARALFAKLAAENGAPKSSHSGRTPSASGIRPPSRLSMQLAPAPPGIKPKMHNTVPSSNEWSLKATYVEVIP
jgi:hypothetical protein